MIKPNRLGRGLDALLGGADKPAAEGELRELPASALRPGKYQPRKRMDQAALEELAASIKQRGVVQPILARATTGAATPFEIVAGERRWRAAQLAGLATVPVLVREIADDAALGIGLIENLQREDLNAIEEAAGLKRLIAEFGLTHEQAADAVGRSRVAVSNLLRLLELAQPVQEMLADAKLDMGHGRALLGVGKARQVELAHQIVHKGLTVRDAERLVRAAAAPPKPPASKTGNDADTRRLENELSEKLGTAVALNLAGKKGRGTLEIQFLDYAHLDALLERMRLK